ncbi:uncharacterized protein RAG0_11543 [Rhynchosporium agropyri]|uniref:Uncharacterized protein n=1 Tax=Rhynchosporium agropyri TaxID=914238 RepID=A0A1E1L4J3_9HELO|nr:uncharacterized protein RAG0_11543 [Rhynchosporium agropyri]
MHFLQPVRSLYIIRILLWVSVVSVSAAGSNETTLSIFQNSNVPLRILPLGNSITFGFQSTDGNGYRKRLLEKITTSGPAQYIGSVLAGNMTDNHNEGHPGAIITEISNYSRVSLVLRPNLILLMAGTNDMNNDLLAGASDRLGDLIDLCFTACPDSVILVAQLTPSVNASVEARIEQFNPTVVSVAAIREQRGMKIAVVNMMNFVTTADLEDELHPNDVGYAKMADAWYEGIQRASMKGWFTPPVDITTPLQSNGNASPLIPVSTSASSSFTFIPSSIASSIAWATSSTLPTFTASATSPVFTSSLVFMSSQAPATTAPSTYTTDATLGALAAPTMSRFPMASQAASRNATNHASLSFGRNSLGNYHLVYLLAFVGVWL